jgi:dTMP kinase
LEGVNLAKLIAFEGLDNLGKTTQINLLKKILPSDAFAFTSVLRDGGTASHIRSMLASVRLRSTMTAEVELLLYTAALTDAVHSIILPALGENKHVICDRYLHSAFAYQSGLKGFSEEVLLDLHRKFCNDIQPDIVFYFYGKQFNNINKDNPGGYDDLLETEKKCVENVYEKYFGNDALFKGKIVRIQVDNRSESEVHPEIMNHLQKLGLQEE